jgi:hypothetical protein
MNTEIKHSLSRLDETRSDKFYKISNIKIFFEKLQLDRIQSW